ncbi:hypothetical protein BHE74_00016222 [Ensete ventricosum]|nr:hypothetical protein BHE74_00016222 [Ensete ventricosum]
MELKRDSGEGGRTESNRFPAPINRRGQVEASNPGVEFRVTVVGGTQKRCAFHRIQSFNTRRSHRYPSRGPPRDRCLLVIAWGPLSDFIATRETRLPRAPLPLAPTSHLPRPAKKEGGGGGGGGKEEEEEAMPHGYYLSRVQVNHFPAASCTVPHREPDALHEVPTPPPPPNPSSHGGRRHRLGRSEVRGSAALEWRNKHPSPTGTNTHTSRHEDFWTFMGEDNR